MTKGNITCPSGFIDLIWYLSSNSNPGSYTHIQDLILYLSSNFPGWSHNQHYWAIPRAIKAMSKKNEGRDEIA